MGNSSNRTLSEIRDALEDLRAGKMVILIDDSDRENEGDLVCIAEKVTPQMVNFMATHGRGLICLALEQKIVDRLKIPMMVSQNHSGYGTNFTVSIEAAKGVSTGISAPDRAKTILDAVNPDAKPTDIVSPGHIFPLRADKGGVLKRAGHTEGSVDLAKLAGFQGAGVICEIMNEDGTMARRAELERFASKFNLKICSIADLIRFRMNHESLVKDEEQVRIPSQFGEFQLHVFSNEVDNAQHVALVKGQPTPEEACLVRVHSECLTGDVFQSLRCDCGPQLDDALKQIAASPCGVLLYLRQEGRGIGLLNKMKAYRLQDSGLDTVEANEKLGFKADLRDYGIGAQMLRKLGVRKMKLLTNNPRKIVGLDGYGLELVERVPLQMTPEKDNLKYLTTKKERLGHLLNFEAARTDSRGRSE